MIMDDPLSYLMNAHEWYTLDTSEDHLRAWLWCLSNFMTFVSYFMIPVELAHWRVSIPSSNTVRVLSRLFIAFIVLCGLSHLTMLVVMPTAPWWVTIVVYTPMAVVSFWTVLVLREHRRYIVEVLKAMDGLFIHGV